MKKKFLRPGKCIIGILLFLGAVTMVFPFIWMLLSSVKGQTELLQMPPTFWPERIRIENYTKVLSAIPFVKYFMNSVLTALINTAVGILTSALAGYVFAKYQFKGKELLFWIMISCMMIPYDTLIIPLYKIMVKMHWTNTYLVLTIPFFVNIFGMFMMRQFMESVPNDYIEAAEIDGCGQYKTFFRVVFPIVKPAVAALCIFIFMGSYNSFLWPLITVNSRDLFTLPIGMASLTTDRKSEFDLLMAASTMAVVPVFLVFCCAQRYFVSGLTMGGVKG